ncbi:ABC transporter permease [Candidatus Enterococcus clewellii]|uniref:ABC transporter permease n=1 Tax=Candidatus Enterococcus clewellii TaxID=1834193 RepID=A0A242K6P6_9ENTE|nr:ABC transporter permease [Enterococcus sp. 9E7_DIV0242]OTP15991.1 hypothetical protein A5888_002205 [Enterococcus sp. 9E7_DIV0242]
MNSIRFEEKKIWKQRKNYVLVAIGLIVIVVLFLFNRHMGIVENNEIDQEAVFSGPILGRKEFDTELEEYLTSVNLMIDEQEATFLAAADKGESLEESLTLPTYPFYRAALNNELINKELPPYSMRYGTQSSVFSAIVLTGIASLLGIIFFLFLFGDSLTKEFEERTMNLCLTQPISRVRLYLLKYSLTVGHSFLLTIFLVVVASLIGLGISGASSWQYPIIVFTEMSMTFIPIIQYMARVLGLFLFVLLFCFAIHFLFSTLFRKTTFSLLATIFILAEGHFISVSSNEVLRKIAHLNPFTYLNVGKLFIGYDFREYGQYNIENQEYYANWCLPRTLHNPQIEFTQGLLVLGVTALLIFCIGCYCFRKNIRLDV